MKTYVKYMRFFKSKMSERGILQMKRKWKKLIVSLMSGIMIATTAATTVAATTTIVGATTVDEMTVSDNVLQDINQDSEKNNIDPGNEDVKLTYDQYDMLTDEEVQRELSATATESQDIMKTESGACKYLFLGQCNVWRLYRPVRKCSDFFCDLSGSHEAVFYYQQSRWRCYIYHCA